MEEHLLCNCRIALGYTISRDVYWWCCFFLIEVYLETPDHMKWVQRETPKWWSYIVDEGTPGKAHLRVFRAL